MQKARISLGSAALACFLGCQSVRSSTPAPASAPLEVAQSALGFEGLWKSSYGVLRLTAAGERVEGTYSAGGGRIEGTVSGSTLRATYVEADGAAGRAVFALLSDGMSFEGKWRPGEAPLELDSEDAEPWRGERIVPVPGRTWLIVLEHYWEESLADPEYSYGAMLRAFFQRLPAVEVRQRFFHDEADLLRALDELAGLAEPAVLYISSHGTRAGLSSAGGTIDGTAVGAALGDAGELRLIHLGACDVLAGDFARDLRAASGKSVPISGYTQTVDWAASAIVDFTYLNLILEGGLAPAEAQTAVRRMLSFAGEPTAEAELIAGCGLTLLAP
jgi:hypothetical protein